MAATGPKPASAYFTYPDYDFVRPAELDGHTQIHAVIIVGAGPVGLTAALELARHGIKSLVLDDKSTVSEGSRAICIARHSMECFQQLGVAEAFVNKALPWTHGTSYYRDREVYRLQMPHSEAERFYPMYNLQQQYIELFLAEAANKEDLIDVRWQSRVTDVSRKDKSVEVEVSTAEGKYRVQANYLLAADGARSVVRNKLGLQLKGDAYEGRYVIADIQMQSTYPTERRAFFDPVSNPGLTILIHKQPENIWRIDYQLDEAVDAEKELEEQNIRARIASILAMIEEEGEWTLEWWSLYKAYTLALDDYRHGRVFFLGDAAHLVPIFGVRGLNSGIADAMNIAWKLACVLNRLASDRLLDTYTPERRGATLDVFENAGKSTKFMTPPTRGHQLMRDAVLSLALDNDFARPLINPRQSQPYTYADSPVSFTSSNEHEFSHGIGTGAPISNQRSGDTDYLLDYIGRGFSGIYFCTDTSALAALLELTDKLGLGAESFKLIMVSPVPLAYQELTCVHDSEGEIFSHYDAVNGSFYLLRPDRHVLARWKKLIEKEVLEAFTQCLKGGKSE